MIVCKFGGSSLADAGQMSKVKSILLSNSRRGCAVVSAPGKRNKRDEKITDLLYRSQSEHDALNEVANRFDEIENDLGLERVTAKEILALKDEIAQNSPDFAASRGEHFSAKVMARFLCWEFVDSAEFVVINSDGSINPETYEKAAAILQKGRHYVIPGFYGRDTEGNIKTFSRGGSDITGAIIARALQADLYENWTDVSGVCYADPRIVEGAAVVPELTYEELHLLAEYGASVFHPDAVAPVENLIPINIRNTNSPDDPGTFIRAERDYGKQPYAGTSANATDVVLVGYGKIIESFPNEPNIPERIKSLYREFIEPTL